MFGISNYRHHWIAHFRVTWLCIVTLCFIVNCRFASSIRDKNINGKTVYFVTKEVTNREIKNKCKEFEPSTNKDVESIINALEEFGIVSFVWIKSSHDPSKSISNSFSWKSEAVDKDLWFTKKRWLKSPQRIEPNDKAPCTILRKYFVLIKSITGKHMLGNRDCSSTAYYLCEESYHVTTPKITIPLITITTSTVMTTTPPPATTEMITSTTSELTATPQATTETTGYVPTTGKELTITNVPHQRPFETTLEDQTTNHHVTTELLPLTTRTYETKTKNTAKLQQKLVPVMVCPCTCPEHAKLHTNVSTKQVQQLTNQLQQNLSVTFQELSATQRKKISATDSRPTSKIGGILAIILMAMIFGALLVFDFAGLLLNKIKFRA